MPPRKEEWGEEGRKGKEREGKARGKKERKKERKDTQDRNHVVRIFICQKRECHRDNRSKTKP